MGDRNTDIFVERILGEMNAGLSCLNLYLGYRLGLFKALADSGPITIEKLSKQKGLNERYMREWLECMTVNEYLDYDAENGCFSLPSEYVPVLVDQDSPYYIAPYLGFIPGMSLPINLLMDAFRSGRGVPFSAYGEDLPDAIGLGNRVLFTNDYVNTWIRGYLLCPTSRNVLNLAPVLQILVVAQVGQALFWQGLFPRFRLMLLIQMKNPLD